MDTDAIYFGNPGHFWAADRWCSYHLHAHVSAPDGSRYCVSAVGDYYPPDRNGKRAARERLNANPDSFYELMVFKVVVDETGREVVEDYNETILQRSYDEREKADEGHAIMVASIAAGLEPPAKDTEDSRQAGLERLQVLTSDYTDKLDERFEAFEKWFERQKEDFRREASKLSCGMVGKKTLNPAAPFGHSRQPPEVAKEWANAALNLLKKE